MEVVRIVAVAGEGHPLADQPFDRLAPALDHEAHGIVVAQARPRDVGIADVVFDGIRAVQDRRDPPLGPAGGAVEELVLGHQRDLVAPGQAQRRGHSGQAATDYQNVVSQME